MLEALRQVPLFADLINNATGCIPFLKQGVERWLDPGEVFIREGEPVDFFYVLLDGEVQVTKRVGGQEMVLTTHAPGAFFGEVPLLMDSPFVATGRALRPSRVYGLTREVFWQMLGGCPAIRRAILQKMAERLHDIEMVTQRRERLVALGTLAAGFAHELNNPAAASRRAAAGLRECLEAAAQTPPGIAPSLLASLRRDALARRRDAPRLDPLAQSDLEDALAAWLEARGAERGWERAPTFVSAGLDAGWLAERVPAEATPAVIPWLAAVLNADGLLEEVEHGAARVSELVESVKSYSFMDQAPVQEIDIHDGLDDTLTMMAHRLEEDKIALHRDYDRTLPCLTVYGGELNEVWTSLLENAFDAVGGSGHVRVRTARESIYALVEIGDDGPGIPADILPRIFEPFFTTKNIGEGKGLGLDSAYRIVVARHHGDIHVLSEPGDTRFQVRLPLAGVEATA